MKKIIVALVLSLTICSTSATARQAFVIELHNQLPETILPAIKPLLSEGDSATGFQSEIIVTASADTFATIETLVKRLDAPLHNLLIQVKDHNQGNSSSNSSGLSGGIKREKIAINTGKPISEAKGATISKDGLAYSAHSTTRHYSTRSSQHVRALEGSPAYIATGQSVPYTSRGNYGYGSQTEFVDVLSGFYVTARLIGDRVFLTISTQRDSLDNSSHNRHGQKSINTNQLNTTVSGKVGEWISLGGVTLGDKQQGQGLLDQQSGYSASLGNISLQVNLID